MSASANLQAPGPVTTLGVPADGTISKDPPSTTNSTADLATDQPAVPDSQHHSPPSLQQHLLPFGFCKQHGLVAVEEHDEITLYCRNDAGFEPIIEARRVMGRAFTLSVVDHNQFASILQKTYEARPDSADDVIANLGEELDLQEAVDALAEPADLLESADDAPIIRLLNALLAAAINDGASDIHIEPFENRLQVRFRVDGVLREVLEPPAVLAPLLVSRIKVMARLDIAEKRLPLDGRISLRIAGRAVDVRVSTLPSGHGERVVMRLLDKQSGTLDLGHLGMSGRTRALLQELIQQPHGIILVTGPTGSGKTTSLYAALGQLNSGHRNIMTVEDPIEYYVQNISQVQVNSKVELSFARGLRAILRQDPDVVMVGEIRDLETSQIAVQASLTGHLVLSTLHTNTAVGAITRLRDMGVEPFLLSSSLIGVMAQRLVRVLCSACKTSRPANPAEREYLGLAENSIVHQQQGCPHCNHLGFRGRTGIYELIVIDDRMREMIHDNRPERLLEDYAHQHFAEMVNHGREKVLAGETTVDEVMRVCRQEVSG